MPEISSAIFFEARVRSFSEPPVMEISNPPAGGPSCWLIHLEPVAVQLLAAPPHTVEGGVHICTLGDGDKGLGLVVRALVLGARGVLAADRELVALHAPGVQQEVFKRLYFLGAPVQGSPTGKLHVGYKGPRLARREEARGQQGGRPDAAREQHGCRG